MSQRDDVYGLQHPLSEAPWGGRIRAERRDLCGDVRGPFRRFADGCGIVFACGWIACTAPRYASANDVEVGGTGTDLVPLENTVVEMADETIALRLRGDAWHVRARYTFHNPASERQPVTLGFPEHTCGLEPEDCPAQMFERMKTRVRGRPVAHRLGRLRQTHPWAELFGPVWLYDVALAPQESIDIVHEYAMRSSGSVTGAKWVQYVTRTGALWSGPIGHATFTFILPRSALLLGFEPDVPVTVTRHNDELWVVLERVDWEPEHDLTLHYATEDFALPWTKGGEPGGFDWDAAMTRSGTRAQCVALGQLSPGDLIRNENAQGLATELAASSADLRLCRNAVYARRGHVFRDAALNHYFYGESSPSIGPRAHFAWTPTTSDATPLFATDRTRLRVIDLAETMRARVEVSPPRDVAVLPEGPPRSSVATPPPSSEVESSLPAVDAFAPNAPGGGVAGSGAPQESRTAAGGAAPADAPAPLPGGQTAQGCRCDLANGSQRDMPGARWCVVIVVAWWTRRACVRSNTVFRSLLKRR